VVPTVVEAMIGGPVEGGMKPFGLDLEQDSGDEDGGEDCGADEVPQVHRHG
jgi:hypothetical protein